MKISIIIPYYKNKDTITLLIESIKDQDYENWEIVIVMDGRDEDEFSFLEQSFGNDKNIILKCLDTNSGAPTARNMGAYLSSGKFLFFVDADCQLYPGTLSTVIDTFKDNKDASFVYGNYRFDKQTNFTSKPFNFEELKTFNYITTMSPVNRDVFNSVGGFREGLEFFQDWDLFYRIAKKGHKGKWINEFLFSTKRPTEDSISGSQGKTLAEKCNVFYELNDITPKDLVVTTFAAPLQAKHRANILGADYCGKEPESSNHSRYPINLNLDQWKSTLMVGLFNNPQQAINNHFSVMKGKKIIQWIGTDVWQLRNTHSFEDLKCIRESLIKHDITSFANSKRLQKSLKDLGIESELLYAPIHKIDKFKVTKRFPEKYTVAVYFSDTPNMNELEGTGNMSNIPLVMDVANSMPDIEFKFFGDIGRIWKNKEGEVETKRDNVEFCGRIEFDEMNDFINDCSCIIRCTQHDGFPQLPIQFMLCGRDSIVSVPDKEFIANTRLSFEEPKNYMEHKNEIINAIYELSNKPRPTLGETRITGEVKRTYYSELCCEKRFKKEILDATQN